MPSPRHAGPGTPLLRPGGGGHRAPRAGDAEAERVARHRVHTAKVALGERGTPWWDQRETERRARWSEGLDALDEGADGNGEVADGQPARPKNV
ncbi:hypothetical protein ACFU8I_08850 [Streptomyces sp. NPDC057540]|uniref:hypothetical protein n=1 Tax=Streptomyces sp. NPDC057540 TaxID=3346160 RepID=UPI0036887076